VTTPDPRPAGTPGSDPTLGSLGRAPGSPLPGSTAGTAPGTATGPVPPAAVTPGPPSPPPARQPARRTGRAIGRTLALALLIFVTVMLVLFVVFNTQTVEISLVFADVRAPQVVALLIAAVLGGAVIGLLGALMSVRGRRKNR
jgi:uncharacterized integral membrane protein